MRGDRRADDRARRAEIARLTAELAASARAYLDTRDEYIEAAACREEARRALLDIGIALGIDVPPLAEIEPVRANWQRYAAAAVEAAKATAAARAVPPDVEARQPATVGGLLATAPVVVDSDDSAAVSLVVAPRWGVRMDDGDEIRWCESEHDARQNFAQHVAHDRNDHAPAPSTRGPIGEAPDVR